MADPVRELMKSWDNSAAPVRKSFRCYRNMVENLTVTSQAERHARSEWQFSVLCSETSHKPNDGAQLEARCTYVVTNHECTYALHDLGPR